MSAPASSGPTSPPRLLAHADWGSDPRKRWMAVATLSRQGVYEVEAPEPVGELSSLLRRLWDRAGGEGVLLGFDFPIGLPIAYARLAGIESFIDMLPELGSGEWERFYEVAERPEEVGLRRPFYPRRPGGTRQKHLLDGLRVEHMDDLLRCCDRPTEARNAASPIFWTLGGKQVGRAAIIGWRDLLAPALRESSLPLRVWPFDGAFEELDPGSLVVAETYPAEACVQLGLRPPGRGWSKRSPAGRAAQAVELLGWAEQRPVVLGREMSHAITEGFGPRKDGDDPFDATVGLFSMIDVALGHRSCHAPGDPCVRRIEGWILGLS